MNAYSTPTSSRAQLRAWPKLKMTTASRSDVQQVQRRPQQPGVGAQLGQARLVVRLVE